MSLNTVAATTRWADPRRYLSRAQDPLPADLGQQLLLGEACRLERFAAAQVTCAEEAEQAALAMRREAADALAVSAQLREQAGTL